MKKVYVLFLSVIFVDFANSQPILTQANTAPQLGESYVFSRINWDGIAPSAGINQTWNYANIIEISTTAFDFVAPSTCPSPSSFPSANISAYYTTGPQYEHNKINSTSWERVGFYAASVAIPYSDSETMLTFPFTYNDTYVDPFGGTFVNGVVWDRVGDVTVTADGYGTLILPNATIPNVLRVKVVEDYGDFNSGTEIYHYNIDIYMFYKPGYHQPIFALTHYVQGTTTVNYGNYIDDPTLGVSNESLNKIAVYPNPVKTELFINWNNSIGGEKKVAIHNILGELVYSSNQVVNAIDMNDFESGIYVIQLWHGDKKEIMKFIKE